MKKMVNKKGQQFSTTTLLVIIIGVIALIVVIVGFSQGWSFIFDKLGFLPDDLNSAAVACASYAGNPSLALSYCQYRELTIENKKGYYNCNSIHVAAERVLGEGKSGFETQTCSNTIKNFCATLKSTDIPKIVVNGADCPDVTLDEAKALCKIVGEKFSYKEGDDWQSHTCVAGEGTISP